MSTKTSRTRNVSKKGYTPQMDDDVELEEEFKDKPSSMRFFDRFLILMIFLVIGLFIAFIVSLTVTIPHDAGRHEFYDYVVIGGGPAGCTVAERLSREHHHTVLLLEAGPDVQDDPILNEITPLTGTIEDTYYGKYFWQHAQDYAEVIPHRLSLQLTTGRLFGGGSKINGAQFVRGTKWMFDTWADVTDDPIWATTNVITQYKALESYHAPSYNPSVRGNAGPLSIWETMTVAPQAMATSLAEKVATAFEQFLPVSRLADYNDLSPSSETGTFLQWQITAYPNGTRSSSDVSIMTHAVRARTNLHLSFGSTAVKVLFDDNKHARAVRYIKEGKEHIAHGTRRIILSAGVNTAQILQHSGIGDADLLESLDIPVIYDNPNVGHNMVNQQLFTAIFTKNQSDLPSANPADIYEGGAFLADPNDIPTSDVSPRRIQIININAGPVMAMSVINLQPLEAGYSVIRDKDPLRVTASSDRIFDESNGQIDLDTFVAALNLYVCGAHNEFQGLGMGPAVDTDYFLIDPPQDYCGNNTLLQEWVIANAKPHTHHWTSACKMGKEGDGISVVNGKGTVWGVRGLTIADDSILPRNHDGNTVAPAYLVGKIIAEEVLANRFY